MSKIALSGSPTGTGVFTIESPSSNTSRTLVLPDEAGTVLTTTSGVAKAGDTMTGTLNTPRVNINGAPDGEQSENNGRYSSRHISFPSYIYKDSSGNTKGEAYYGIGGSDLTLINYASNGVVRMVTNGIEALKADSAGRVTMPYQPAFNTNSWSPGSIPNGTKSVISSPAYLNQGNHYNNAGIFTAPVAGVYHFFMQVTPISSTSGPHIFFDVNSSGVTYGSSLGYNASYNSTSSAVVLSLNANDTVRAIVEEWNNANVNIWKASWGGYLVG